MTERTLSDDKWVRIMADYSSDGVWEIGGAATCAEELPVSPALLARLAKWCAWYEQSTDYLPPDHPEYVNFPIVEFSAEGLDIARAVKVALPDWTVIYFDEAKAPRHIDRLIYEYEVAAQAGETEGRDAPSRLGSENEHAVANGDAPPPAIGNVIAP